MTNMAQINNSDQLFVSVTCVTNCYKFSNLIHHAMNIIPGLQAPVHTYQLYRHLSTHISYTGIPVHTYQLYRYTCPHISAIQVPVHTYLLYRYLSICM